MNSASSLPGLGTSARWPGTTGSSSAAAPFAEGVGSDAVADCRGLRALHARCLPHEGIYGTQECSLRHVQLYAEAIGFVPHVELNLKGVPAHGNDALLVGLGAVDQLAVDDLAGRLICIDVLDVGLAVGSDRPLHKARALLDANIRAGEEAGRVADG